jgi:hypothetical protein
MSCTKQNYKYAYVRYYKHRTAHVCEDTERYRQFLFVQYHACEVGQLEKACGVMVQCSWWSRCVHVILSMEGKQSVMTGDFPSNGVHVRITDLYFE